MSRDWTVLGELFCVCLVLVGILLVDGRHHQDGTQVVHRHRHRHESSSPRWHHNYPRSWRDDEDYEDADDESENDYDSPLYSRSYLKGHRDRYDSRHLRPYYRAHHVVKFSDRRRKSHYGIRERHHRIRPSRDRTYRKGSWEYDDDDDESDYFDDYDKMNRYDEDELNESDEFYPIRRSFRKHRIGDYENDDHKEQRGRLESRWDWKFKNSIRKDDRRDRRRKFGYRGISRNRFHDDSDDDVDEIFRIGKKKILKMNGTRHDYEETVDDLFDDEGDDDDNDNDADNEEDDDDDYNENRYSKDGERILKGESKHLKIDGRFSKADKKYSKDDDRHPKEDKKSNSDNKHFTANDKRFSSENKYSNTGGEYSSTDENNLSADEKNSDKIKQVNTENDDPTTNDNDFYENDVNPSLKKYDDIIRRLTSDDPITPKSEIRRDYRNIEIGKYLKRDAYGNLKYEPKNYTKVDLDFVTMSAMETSTAISIVEKKSNFSVEIRATVVPQILNVTTKSSEQDYDYGDNEQDDDPTTQTDGNNADYGEDENDDVDEDDENTLSTSTTSTTSTSTTLPTTTTTTQKPTEARFFHKSMKNYERSTGAQYNGYQSKNDYPPMSAHSVQKWQSLGSRESIKETRDKYPEFKNNGKSAEVNEALQHAIKVSREGSCQWPRARIVPVRDVYPSTSTTYIPHCAILHRCSDDTGCCRSEALTCVPKQSHRVELYFYTTNLEGSSVVEKLTFYNHTECECRERSELGAKAEKTSETRFARHHPPVTPQNLRKSPPKKPCRCPSEFLPKISLEGECQCKCSDSDQNCIRTRRGKVFFSIRDRLCIHNGDCSPPICEFGEYMSRQGKCPRKQEQFSFYSKYQTNVHHGFRS